MKSKDLFKLVTLIMCESAFGQLLDYTAPSSGGGDYSSPGDISFPGDISSPGGDQLSCVDRYACNVRGPNLLGYYNISTEALATSTQEHVEMCQVQCQQTPDCQHFTWYDSDGVFPNTCYLYSQCKSQVRDCVGCHSGPKYCSPPSYRDCRAIETDFGGTWFCFPEISSLYTPVAHGSKCIFQCPQHVTYHVCKDGVWSSPPGEKRCLCPAVGADRDVAKDGRVVCWPPRSLDEPAHAGTYCIHACHGHPKEEFTCHHGHWTADVDALTCTAEDNRGVSAPVQHFVKEESRRVVSNNPDKKYRTIGSLDNFGYELVIEEELEGEKPIYTGVYSPVRRRPYYNDTDLLAPKSTYAPAPDTTTTYYSVPTTYSPAPTETTYREPKTTYSAPTEATYSPPKTTLKSTYASLKHQDPEMYPPPKHHDDDIASSYFPESRHNKPLLSSSYGGPPKAPAYSRPKPIVDVPKAVPHVVDHSGGKVTKIGYKLLEDTTTPVPYHHTTVKAQGLPSLAVGHKQSSLRPYPPPPPPQPQQHYNRPLSSSPSRHHYGGPAGPKVYSYQHFNSPHASFDHGSAHGAKSHHHHAGHAQPSAVSPVPIHYSSPTSAADHRKRYGYTVYDKDGKIYPKVLYHSGGHKYRTSPPASAEAEESGAVSVSSVSTNRPSDLDAAAAPAIDVHHRHPSGGHHTPTYTSVPTPRAPTRPPIFTTASDSTSSTTHADYDKYSTTLYRSSIPTPTPYASTRRADQRSDTVAPSVAAPTAKNKYPSIHPMPHDLGHMLKYKLLKPAEFFRLHANTSPAPAVPTRTSSSTSVEEVIREKDAPPPTTTEEYSYKLLKTPVPSAESKLKPGEISELPPQSSHPFVRKHSFAEFSVYRPGAETTVMAPKMVHTSLGVSTTPPFHTTAETATMDYGVLFRNQTDSAHFEEAKESLKHADANSDNDDFSLEPRVKKETDVGKADSETPINEVDGFFFGGADELNVDKKFIGFNKNSFVGVGDDFTFPKDGDDDFGSALEAEEEGSLMESARKKYMEQKRKKIVFVSKKRANKSIPEDSPLWKEGNSFEDDNDDDKSEKFPNFPVVDKNMKKCLEPAPVPNGRFRCVGKVDEGDKKTIYYGHGSTCVLTCDPGYATAGDERATCGGRKGAWMSNSPLECHEAVAVLVGGWSPIWGVMNEVEVYDARPGSKCNFTRMASLPSPRRGLTATWINGRVLACGGVNETREHNRCWTYSPGLDRWLIAEAPHAERHFAAGAKVGAAFYALGGRDGRRKPMALGGVERFEDGRWEVEDGGMKLSQERAYHCAAAVEGDAVVVTGGYSYNAVVGMAEVYNVTAGGGWTKAGATGNLREARYLHGCAAVSMPGGGLQGVLVAGGYSTEYLDSAEVFNPRTLSWEPAGRLSQPRQGGRLAVLDGGRPVLLGGFHSMKEFPDAAEEFDPETRTWSRAANTIRVPRRYFGLAQVPRSLFGC